MARPQTDIDAGRENLIDLMIEMIEERGSTNLTVTELAAVEPRQQAAPRRAEHIALTRRVKNWFRMIIRIS